MKRDVFLAAAAGLSLLNGVHNSPFFDPVSILLKPFVADAVGLPLPRLHLHLADGAAHRGCAGGALRAKGGRQREDVFLSLGNWLVETRLLGLPSPIAAMTGR